MMDTLFNTLPQDVQEKAKHILKAYDEVHIIYEYGRYNVSANISLKAEYAADHKFIGSYKAKEIFTEEERIINYIESFHEYPIQYKGKRDYKMLNEIGNDWNVKFKFDENGNLVLA